MQRILTSFLLADLFAVAGNFTLTSSDLDGQLWKMSLA